MPIEFACPQCGQRLRVPETSAGKQARCPKCSSVVRVPAPQQPLAAPPGPSPPANPSPAAPQFPAPQASAPTPPQQPTWPTFGDSAPSSREPTPGAPAAPAPNPFAFNTGGAPPVGDSSAGAFQPSPSFDFSGSQKPVNPYSSPQTYSPAAAMPRGGVGHQVVDAGVVISYAWEVWKANLGLLIGVFITVGAITDASLIPLGALQVFLESQGASEAAILVAMMNYLVILLVATFLFLGQTQIILKLARGQRASFSDLFGGASRFLPVLAGSVLFTILYYVGALMCVVPGVFFVICFWPMYYLLVDGRAGVIDSFSIAFRITEQNRLATFVLMLAAFGIYLLGFLAVCVGLLFALPLIFTMYATAYLMMSGQIPVQPRYGY